jgi:hypothetical protein
MCLLPKRKFPGDTERMSIFKHLPVQSNYFWIGVNLGLADTLIEASVSEKKHHPNDFYPRLWRTVVLKPLAWGIVWPFGVAFRVADLLTGRNVYD